MTKESLFEAIGGESALGDAVELFYSKVIQDDRINRFFWGVDLDALKRMQMAFLAFALRGPQDYNGRSMRSAHAHLVDRGLNDHHFDVVLEHLIGTLGELKLSPELVSNVASIAESTREDVLGRAPELFRTARGGK